MHSSAVVQDVQSSYLIRFTLHNAASIYAQTISKFEIAELSILLTSEKALKVTIVHIIKHIYHNINTWNGDS